MKQLLLSTALVLLCSSVYGLPAKHGKPVGTGVFGFFEIALVAPGAAWTRSLTIQ